MGWAAHPTFTLTKHDLQQPFLGHHEIEKVVVPVSHVRLTLGLASRVRSFSGTPFSFTVKLTPFPGMKVKHVKSERNLVIFKDTSINNHRQRLDLFIDIGVDNFIFKNN